VGVSDFSFARATGIGGTFLSVVANNLIIDFNGVDYYRLTLNHEAGTACFKTAYGGEDRA